MRLVPRRALAALGGARGRRGVLLGALVAAALAAGCAHWNTYYNANKAFNAAERVRADKIKAGGDISQPTADQKKNYELAIQKAQIILDEYPGSGLTDDALFLMAKSYYRLGSYRMSLAKLDLLFANFPQTSFEEEAVFTQVLDFLGVGDLARSSESVERLRSRFPESRFRAEALRVSAENSFTLQDWEAARRGFTDYLDQFPKESDRDRIGYELAQTLFELKVNDEAVQRLQTLLAEKPAGALGFDAGLLLARALIRLARYDDAAGEIALLRPDAEMYRKQGDVALVEAEALLRRGRPAEAAPLLENMPQAWNTPIVAARVADLLGRIYVRQGKLDDAGKQLRDAVRNVAALYDPLESRRVSDALRDYLAADQALAAARPDKVPGLKLAKANALLLGLGWTRRALGLYLEVAAAAAVDSASAARGLFGAALVYRDSLAQADSAATLLARLQGEFPRSLQAFVARAGEGDDLLTFLRAERDRRERTAPADSTRSAREQRHGGAAVEPPPADARAPGLMIAPPAVAPAATLVPAPAAAPAAAPAPADTGRAVARPDSSRPPAGGGS